MRGEAGAGAKRCMEDVGDAAGWRSWRRGALHLLALVTASLHGLFTLPREFAHYAPRPHFTLFTPAPQEHEGLHHHPPHRLLRAADLGTR